MNRILTKNYKKLINVNLNQPFYLSSTSYQTQQQFKKPRIKRQNDQRTPKNEPIVITDKINCLEHLQTTTKNLINDLKNLKWLQNIEDSHRQLKNLHTSYDLNLILTKYFESKSVNSLVEYINTNFDTFSTKEKSLVFKLLAIVNQQQKFQVKNAKLNELLTKLEIDYYDNLEKCDLIDYVNYLDGFYHFRDSNLHFISKSTDKIFRKALNSLNELNTADTVDPVDSLNKLWYENLRHENPILLGMYALNRLTFLNNDAKSIYFHLLISNQNEILKNSDMNVLSTVLGYYNMSQNQLKLSHYNKEQLNNLFNSNLTNIIENINDIKSSKVKTSVVDWLCKLNSHDDELIKKYKIGLIEYFFKDLKRINRVPELTTDTKCISMLINSFNKSGRNIKNSFFKTYEPLFNKLVDKYVRQNSGQIESYENIINFDTKNLNKTRKFITKSRRDQLSNKFNYLYEYFDLYSMGELVECSRKGELRWLSEDMVRKFESNYNYDLNSMTSEVRQMYLLEASRIQRETGQLQLSKKVLDSILKEYVLSSKEKSFQKKLTTRDLSAAIVLILSNHEYSVYKFNMLQPYIDNLIDQDLSHIGPIVEVLMNDFYYETFPGKTSDILNRIRNKIASSIMSYSDEKFVDLNEMVYNLSALFKAKNRVKFETNSNLDIGDLKMNLEKCLSEFEQLCSVQVNESRLRKFEVKNLSDRVKQFENRVYRYTLALKQMANLALLSDDYNLKLFSDLTSCVVKLLNIFHDNLFNKIIVDKTARRNYFNKDLICDLMSVFGLFNYYDVNYLIRNINDPAKRAELVQDLKELKAYNDNLYSLIKTSDKMELLQIIEYNFNLSNLNFECDQAINDMFEQVKSFDTLIKNLSYLNASRLELLSKMVYFMNQNLCIKHKNSNLEWLFNESKPLLPVDSSFRDVHSTLNSILESNLVLTNPVYEFNFTANFEIAIDENNNFADPRSNTFKYRIPILIVKNSYFFNGTEEFKKPIANYVDNFKKLYPLVTVNSSKLEEMKTMQAKLEYIRERIVKGLEEYAE
ncbi:unnamed protein product, partial [Brachionus calyciflorus]